MTDLEKEISRISNLKQNRGKSKADLEREAQITVWIRQANIEDRFKVTEEKNKASELLHNYLNNYEISNYNQVTQLCDLIYDTILALRIEAEINVVLEDKNCKFVPDKAIASLQILRSNIEKYKENLGISKSKEKDDLTALESLQKRFETYIPFNRNEFHTVCPGCGKMLLLRRRVKDFETLISPFFAGRHWFSRRGIALIKAGIITKAVYAFLFYTSEQFTQYCKDNENKLVEIDGVEQSKIEEFIKNCPYLQEPKIPKKILDESKK